MSGALARALALQRDAAAEGFDWRHLDELWEKLAEESVELRDAVSLGPAAVEEELGDLLFMAVNLARHLGVDPDRALEACNRKFQRRFGHIASQLEKLPPLGHPRRLDAMEALWQEAKRLEKKDAA
ncbi:MAG TPA: MazG nucleotide pyrophosphohydrolase domain-containing protein [Solimonas sp.]|nr:MazG nucleotide pyrophosphohydrolase domain-containing protein [Solimonas sp.]